MTFKEYCEERNVGLTKVQEAAACEILDSPNCRVMLYGAGYGATFLFKLLEEYALEKEHY